jgi:hypothetical protein
MKLTNEKQQFYAEIFTEFINYFLGEGASVEAMKKLFADMVESVESDRKSLT